MSITEKLLEKYKVKVIKPMSDSRITIAGEKFVYPSSADHDGTMVKNGEIVTSGGQLAEYAIVPAGIAEHLKDHNKGYIYSEPYEDVKKK